MAECPNCEAILESYAACGRCNPPCDNVIAHHCAVCGLRATTYNGHWNDVTMEHVKNYGSFRSIDEIACEAFIAYQTVKYEYADRADWLEQSELEQRAWRAAVKNMYQSI